MGIKEKIVELLENNREEYLSGNDIAELLGISRTAVWKVVKKLENEGYIIEAVNNRGYRLKAFTDVLSEAGIKKYLEKSNCMWRFSIYDQVESTNDVIRDKATQGAKEGEVAVALEQTSGKGRMGRRFFSPKNTGLYFSLLLKPEFSLERVIFITTAAAVAVCKAIESISNLRPGIKWVNDILLRNRKVCGIGTEAVFNAELGALDYVVLGIGINIYKPESGFPNEISGKAGYIFKTDVDDVRNRLTVAFLKQFEILYNELRCNATTDLHFVEEYRRRCCILGKDIFVCRGSEMIPAYAINVDDKCRLKVRYSDGSEEYLSSGEISIKFDNYI